MAYPEYYDYGYLTRKKIESFSTFRNGWNYNEGIKFDLDTINLALKLNNEIINNKEIDKTDAFPGLDGDIRIVIYSDMYYLEFTIRKTSNIHIIDYLLEKNDRKIDFKEGITFDMAINIIKEWKSL